MPNLGTTTWPCIKLNGNLLPLKPGSRIQKTDITPFVGKIASGDPKYGDFTYSSRIVLRDFRAGMGLLNARADKPGRYWHATTDMRFPYQVVLPPLVTSTSVSLNSGEQLQGLGEISSKIVAFSRDANLQIARLWSLSAGTWSAATDPFSGSNIVLLFFVRYTPPSGSDTLFAFGTGGKYAYSTNGTSWTAKTESDGFIYCACVFDRKLLIFSGFGIYYSENPSAASPTWTTLLEGMPGNPAAAVSYVDEQGQEAPYFVTKDALWRVNFYTGTLTKVREFDAGAIFAAGGSDFGSQQMVVHNGAIMIGTRRGVLRWTNSSQSWIGPNEDDGLEGGYQGAPVSLVTDVERLWVGISRGPASGGGATGQYSQILVYDDSGWHRIYTYTSTTGLQRLPMMLTNTGATNGYTRVYVQPFTAVAPQYFEIPYINPNPLKVSSSTYESTGDLITAWDDGGFAEVPKCALELAVNYNLQDADSSIAISYALDDSASYTSLGTITGTSDLATITKTLPFGSGYGVAFQKIRFKFTLTRDSGTTTTTPVLNYAILKYVAQPDTKFSWACELDFSAEALSAVGGGLTPEIARGLVDTARASKPLVDFQEWPPSSTTYKVKVANRPESEIEVNGVLESSLRLTVAEIV